jgi:inhibitor of cysteine peptidase
MLQITKARNGSEIEVRPGETFELELPENPTTGYRWHLLSADGSVYKLQDDSFQPSGGTAYGGGGIRRWRFQAVQEGAAPLEVEYRRSWEKQAAEIFKITVRVRG